MDEGTSNRLVSMDLNGTETRTFSHDAAGNMLTDVKSSVATAYTYNNAGRMSAVSFGGTAKGSYIYNANGQLVSRTMLNTTPSDGRFTQARDANGKMTDVRIDAGHPKSHTDPRAIRPHAHVPGVSNSDGTPWLPIR